MHGFCGSCFVCSDVLSGSCSRRRQRKGVLFSIYQGQGPVLGTWFPLSNFSFAVIPSGEMSQSLSNSKEDRKVCSRLGHQSLIHMCNSRWTGETMETCSVRAEYRELEMVWCSGQRRGFERRAEGYLHYKSRVGVMERTTILYKWLLLSPSYSMPTVIIWPHCWSDIWLSHLILIMDLQSRRYYSILQIRRPNKSVTHQATKLSKDPSSLHHSRQPPQHPASTTPGGLSLWCGSEHWEWKGLG